MTKRCLFCGHLKSLHSTSFSSHCNVGVSSLDPVDRCDCKNYVEDVSKMVEENESKQKYGILISDVDEDSDHKEFHMYEKDIFTSLPQAQEALKAYEQDEEYQYQEFKIVDIFTSD